MVPEASNQIAQGATQLVLVGTILGEMTPLPLALEDELEELELLDEALELLELEDDELDDDELDDEELDDDELDELELEEDELDELLEDGGELLHQTGFPAINSCRARYFGAVFGSCPRYSRDPQRPNWL